MDLKESREGYVEGFGGRKRKREVLEFYFNIKNLKINNNENQAQTVTVALENRDEQIPFPCWPVGLD